MWYPYRVWPSAIVRLFFVPIYICIGFLWLCSSCTGPVRDESNVFVYNESAGIASLDPAFARDLEQMWITNQLFDGLVTLDSSLRIAPCIARSWEISEDGTSYTFHLRDSVYFHDSEVFRNGTGRSVTAHDFVYSFSRILDPHTASPGQWIFSKIDTTRQDGFYALNDSTLVIHLQSPFQPFLGILTTQYANVLPHEAVEKYGADFRAHPVGTGPFRFAFWNEEVALVLHRNDRYWRKDNEGRQLPYLDAVKIEFVKDMGVEFQGLLQGRYDFMSGIHASYKDELLTPEGNLTETYAKDIRFQKAPFIKTDYLGFVVDPSLEVSKNSPLLNPRVRKALALSINLREMVFYLRNNSVIPATGFVPPSLGLSSSGYPTPEYNPSVAAEILSQEGFPLGRGIPEIELATTSDYSDLMEFIQREWEKIGVKSRIRVMQSGAFREATARNQVAAFRKSWLADYADAENFLAVFTTENFSPSGPNYSHFSDSGYDALYNAACAELNDSIRYSYYREMDAIITRNLPVIPLFHDQVSHFVRKNIHGLTTNGVNLLDLSTVQKGKS